MHTVWKNEKFTLTETVFRQINFLVISLVKMLLSRKWVQGITDTETITIDWYCRKFASKDWTVLQLFRFLKDVVDPWMTANLMMNIDNLQMYIMINKYVKLIQFISTNKL